MYKQKYKEVQQIHKDIYLYIPKTPRAFRLTGYEFVVRRKKHETV